MRGNMASSRGGRKKQKPTKGNFPQCPDCDVRIVNVFRHLRQTHNYAEAQVGLYKIDSAGHRRKSLPCPDCGKNITRLPRHLRDIHGYPPGTANKATMSIMVSKKKLNHALGNVRM